MRADTVQEDFNQLLDRLETNGIYFEIRRYRGDGISVDITVPGERWEVDFLEDGSIEVEQILSGSEGMHDRSGPRRLVRRFVQEKPAPAKSGNSKCTKRVLKWNNFEFEKMLKLRITRRHFFEECRVGIGAMALAAAEDDKVFGKRLRSLPPLNRKRAV